MIFLTHVQGTQEEVPEIEVNVDTVYIRSNIEKKHNEETGTDYWDYDEKQLTLEEYFRQVVPQDEQAIGELTELFSTYQAQIDRALAELTILIGGKSNV